jgi:hypothetical protein
VSQVFIADAGYRIIDWQRPIEAPPDVDQALLAAAHNINPLSIVNENAARIILAYTALLGDSGSGRTCFRTAIAVVGQMGRCRGPANTRLTLIHNGPALLLLCVLVFWWHFATFSEHLDNHTRDRDREEYDPGGVPGIGKKTDKYKGGDAQQ